LTVGQVQGRLAVNKVYPLYLLRPTELATPPGPPFVILTSRWATQLLALANRPGRPALVRSDRWLDSVLATLPTIASGGGLLGEGMEQT